jgi:hypothetical protein
MSPGLDRQSATHVNCVQIANHCLIARGNLVMRLYYSTLSRTPTLLARTRKSATDSRSVTRLLRARIGQNAKMIRRAE